MKVVAIVSLSSLVYHVINSLNVVWRIFDNVYVEFPGVLSFLWENVN